MCTSQFDHGSVCGFKRALWSQVECIGETIVGGDAVLYKCRLGCLHHLHRSACIDLVL